jgi:hypothetical protein
MYGANRKGDREMNIVPVLTDISLWLDRNGLLEYDCGIELPLQYMCDACDNKECDYYKWIHFQKKLSDKYDKQEINQ